MKISTRHDKSKCTGKLLQGYTGCYCNYCRTYAAQKSKWVVNVKPYEVSVLRETNRHGKESYGWDDTHKKILGSWHKRVDKDVKQAVIRAAETLAAKLNREEQHS